MNIYLSAHFLDPGRVGGAEHMLTNLINGFSRVNDTFAVLSSSELQINQEIKQTILASDKIKLLCKNFLGPRFIQEQLCFLALNSTSDAIVFPNYFTPPYIPRRFGKIITVIHDLQYLHYPNNFSFLKRIWLYLSHQISLRRADHIVAISQCVRDDLIRFYGPQFSKKISVIHNPISWERFSRRTGFCPLDGSPYILSVAAQYPHKNLITLIRAFSLITNKFPDHKLVLIGQLHSGLKGVTSEGLDLKGVIKDLKLSDKVHVLGYIDTDLLGEYYRNADIFVFPSVFEGFGMPPVEAMGFGCPTIVSKLTSLPEVTMGMASYIESPLSPVEWSAKIDQILTNRDAFSLSFDQVKKIRSTYSPENISLQYMDLISTLLNR